MTRRILSLWFPRLFTESRERAEPELANQPFAVTEDRAGTVTIACANRLAEAAGVRIGCALSDARALCPELATRAAPKSVGKDGGGLLALERWAGRFTPWVAREGPKALFLDISGSAHLFGGETALVQRLIEDCNGFGYTLAVGGADTPGAAWAMARFGGANTAEPSFAGNAIDQEARATRARAGKRRAAMAA